MARNREDIEHSGYVDALNVLDRHFDVYEQRLSVMRAPASFPDGEVLHYSFRYQQCLNGLSDASNAGTIEDSVSGAAARKLDGH